jgi:peptidoglycan hydrolase CwlO-like protein
MNKNLFFIGLVFLLLVGAVVAQTVPTSTISDSFISAFESAKNTLVNDPDVPASIKNMFTTFSLQKVNYAQASAQAATIANQAKQLQIQINALQGSVSNNNPSASANSQTSGQAINWYEYVNS